MDIRIEYCVQWDYKPKALSLRRTLESEFGIVAELKPGDRGAFEIFVNDNLIFSKLQLGRFPDDPPNVGWVEIIKLIKEM